MIAYAMKPNLHRGFPVSPAAVWKVCEPIFRCWVQCLYWAGGAY